VIVEQVRTESRATDWKRAFATVLPLVREEWPTLDREAVEETAGDFEKLTTIVAAHLDRTKTVVRRQLLELLLVAESDTAEARSTETGARGLNGSSKKEETSNSKPEVMQVDEVIAAIRRLESFAAGEAKRVSGKVIPMAETKVRQNLWVSILMALGLGMIVGLWLNGGRKSR
jgi:ElaB/YqjD/DUF883 family membrane-anchored ribosome-binding protein